MPNSCTVVFSEKEIPVGFVPLANYTKRGQTVYDRAKRVAESCECDCLALMPEGRLLQRPRKFVHEAEMEAALLKRDQRAGTNFVTGLKQEEKVEEKSVDPFAAHANAICTEIGLLAMAVADLTEAVNALVKKEPAGFSLQSTN